MSTWAEDMIHVEAVIGLSGQARNCAAGDDRSPLAENADVRLNADVKLNDVPDPSDQHDLRLRQVGLLVFARVSEEQ